MLLTGAAVAICVLGAYLAPLPSGGVPMLWQRMMGFGCAAVAVLVFAVATRQTDSAEEEMLSRLRRGQHADFGKRLRKAQHVRTTVKLPVLGETSIRGLVGLAVFAVVMGWWLSPVAPVAVRRRVIGDIAVPLAKEIVAVVLAMPNGEMALLQPPIPPLRTRQLVVQIDDGEINSYQRGLKAIALGNFKGARSLLAKAMSEDDVRPHAIRIARAQNEMYAGRFERAAQWYRDALGAAPDDPMLLCQLAVADMQLGEFDRAEQLVSRAMEAVGGVSDGDRTSTRPVADGVASYRRQERPAGKDASEKDAALGICLHVGAVLKVGLGKQYDEAVQMGSRAREIFQNTPGRPHPFEAASLNNQATIYLLQARYEGGKGLYRRAGDLWTRTLGRHHPYVASGLANLAMLHGNLGQYTKDPARELAKDDAWEQTRWALASHQRSLPETHPILGLSYNASAVVHTALAQYEEAHQKAQKALAICRQAAGPEHASVAACLDTLATVHVRLSRYTRAELDYLRAATVAQQVWGPDHPYLAAIRSHLADLYVRQGRYEDAQELCGQALEVFEKAYGEGHPSVAAVWNTRGALEIARGQSRAARPFLQRALEIREETFGKEHPDVAKTIANLAALDVLSPLNHTRAETGYRRAIEILDKRLGLQHPDVARPLCGLANLYVRQGKYEEAAVCLKRAMAVREKSLVPFHPDLAVTLQAHAALLRKRDPRDTAAADAMEDRAKAIRATHAEEDRHEANEPRQ